MELDYTVYEETDTKIHLQLLEHDVCQWQLVANIAVEI